MRDIVLEETIYIDFSTRAFGTGIPTTLIGTPALSVKEENNATPITAGVSITVDTPITGLHMAAIVATAANGYEAGKGYSVYISAGTVGGVSVVGEKVGEFTISASAAVQEIGTAGAGLTAINLPNQTMDITGSVSGSVGSVTASVTVGDVALADGANLDLGIIDKGTGQAATATTFTGRAVQPDDSVVPGQTLLAFGSTQGYAQAVLIDGVSGDVFSFAAWPTGTTPTGTLTYVVFGSPTASPNALPEVSMNEILGSPLAESAAARLANNFDFFYDNANAQTAQVVDDVGGGGGSGLTAQQTRDAMKLAPTGGAPVAGSIDEHLDDILEDTAEIGTAGAGLTSLSSQTSVDDIPTNAEFNARTLLAASYFDPAADTVATVTNTGTVTGNVDGSVASVTAQVTADITAISGDAPAADNLELMYDGSGYTDDTAPASRAQISQIANVGAAINVPVIPSPNGFTLTTGSEVNNEDATVPLDGTRHELTDAAGTLDAIYKFDIGGDAAPVSVTFTGVYNGNNDEWTISGNTGSDASPVWVQIGTLSGSNIASDVVRPFNMFTNMIVSDIAGQVQIRINGTGLTTSSFDTDQVFLSKSSTSRSVGYANGAIWVDGAASNTSTESFVDGVADNPVSTWAAALTLSASVGINIFHLAPGTSIALSANSDRYEFFAEGATTALGGRSIEGAVFNKAKITGTGTATVTPPTFNNCSIGTATIPPSTQNDCIYTADMTLGSAGDYFVNDGRSGVAGSSSPMLNYNSIGSGSTVNIRAFSGGLDAINIAATTVSSWEFTNGGTAQVTGTGGEVFIRGQVANTVNNSLGSVVMDISGVMNQTTNGVIRTNVAQGPGTGSNQIQLDTGASSTDGAYDPAQIALISGPGAGQSRLIFEYDGTTKTCVLDRNWKEDPTSATTFLITTNPGREHVNEGLLQSATSTTATLNTLASSLDNAYRGQRLFIRSGLGDDQDRLVLSYVGATKVATLDSAWGTIPNGTSGYAMLPSSPVLLSTATQATIDGIDTKLGTPTDTDNATDIANLASDIAALNDFDPVTEEVMADMVKIVGSSTAAAAQAAAAAGIIDTFTAVTGTLTVNAMTTNLTGFDDDRLIGRHVVFTGAPLDGEETDITDYASVGGLVTFNAGGITEAPTNGTTFVII